MAARHDAWVHPDLTQLTAFQAIFERGCVVLRSWRPENAVRLEIRPLPERRLYTVRCRGKRKQIQSFALFGRASFARKDFPPRVLVAADSAQRLFRRRLLEHTRPISCFAARETTLLSMLPGIITD